MVVTVSKPRGPRRRERTVEVAQSVVFPLVGRSWSPDYQPGDTTVLK